MKYFGGIEGGATHSLLIICNEKGETCGEAKGLGTNHWQIGIPECARRIADMVNRVKDQIKLSRDEPLTGLGLGLSGCEQESTNRELEMELRKSYPTLAENYVVCSDTVVSVYTASPNGGMVVIIGTGSNALLRNPDGTSYGCGGWGNFLGDEGSAWHISHRAVKIVFDDMDNFAKSPYPIDRVWALIKKHFKIETRLDLLPHCYAKFDKPFFASLCKNIAELAEAGDQLSLFLFREAGQNVGRAICALLPKVHNDLVTKGEVSIVCVGSVWKSWHLMKNACTTELKRNPIKYDLKFVRATKSMGYGGVYLAADALKSNLPRNYSDNVELIFHYNEIAKANGINGCDCVSCVDN